MFSGEDDTSALHNPLLNKMYTAGNLKISAGSDNNLSRLKVSSIAVNIKHVETL